MPLFLGDRGGRIWERAITAGTFGNMLARHGVEGVARGGRNPQDPRSAPYFAVRSLEACDAGRAPSPPTWLALSSLARSSSTSSTPIGNLEGTYHAARQSGSTEAAPRGVLMTPLADTFPSGCAEHCP